MQPDTYAVSDRVAIVVGELDRHTVDDALRDPLDHPKWHAYPLLDTVAHGLAYQLGDADPDPVCHRNPNAIAERIADGDAVAVCKRVTVGLADAHAQSDRLPDR